ncbi:hypothetical protein L9F63_010875, partial [Diploptera punctata]
LNNYLYSITVTRLMIGARDLDRKSKQVRPSGAPWVRLSGATLGKAPGGRLGFRNHFGLCQALGGHLPLGYAIWGQVRPSGARLGHLGPGPRGPLGVRLGLRGLFGLYSRGPLGVGLGWVFGAALGYVRLSGATWCWTLGGHLVLGSSASFAKLMYGRVIQFLQRRYVQFH